MTERRDRARNRLVATAVAAPFLVGTIAAVAYGVQPKPDQVCVISDRRIVESSGLASTEVGLVTTNDSGNDGEVFTLDPQSCATVGVTVWTDSPVDVESLAPAEDDETGGAQVWVADIGDNLRQRDSVTLARVPVGPGDRTVDAIRYRARYPDEAHDAETLMRNPRTDELVVVTKQALGGRAYAVPEPRADRTVTMREIADGLIGVATGGDFFADGRHVVVRNYAEAAVYTYPDFEQVGRFDLPSQAQGEGIAVTPDGDLLLSSEGLDKPVLRVEVPEEIAQTMAGPAEGEAAPGADGSVDDSPGAGQSPGTSESPGAEATGGQADGSDGHSAEEARWADLWPWLLGGAVGLAVVAVLLLSLRQPRR